MLIMQTPAAATTAAAAATAAATAAAAAATAVAENYSIAQMGRSKRLRCMYVDILVRASILAYVRAFAPLDIYFE